MLIVQVRGKDKYFPEIEDFPYAKSLSKESYQHLKSSLEKDIENYYKQRKYILMLMAKKNKKDKKKTKNLVVTNHK